MRRLPLLGVLVLACLAAVYLVMRPAPVPPTAPAPDGVRVEVPSGQEVVYVDVIQGEPGTAGLVYRFRFIAPAIARQGGTVSMEVAHDDMQALCDGFALPRIADTGPQPGQIIISLSDRPVPFGEPMPEATQYFEAYRAENGKCIWEMY